MSDQPLSGATPVPAVPFACVPGAIPAAERTAHFALITRLLCDAVRERNDIPGGYAFRFDGEAFDDVTRYVTNERRCCPFLKFTIDLSADGGPLWLRLSGPDGTREFLNATMPRESNDQTQSGMDR